MLAARRIFPFRPIFTHFQMRFWRLRYFFFAFIIGYALFFSPSRASAEDPRHDSISDIPHFSALVSSPLNGSNDTTVLFTSPVFTTKFPFSGIGLRWEGETATENNIIFSLSFFDASHQTWSPWHTLDFIGEDAPAFSEMGDFYTRPIFPDFAPQRVRYRIERRQSDDSPTPTVTRVEIIYFDTRLEIAAMPKFRVEHKTPESDESHNTLRIISREEWGADESYRFRNKKEIWPIQQAPIEKFIIHHTAGSDGGDDPAATIRGIYYWHAVVLGWGDMGYNFLIDGQGNIYEGRFGGDTTVGGHTYDDKTQTNYNIGGLGIALLGCFESEEEGCAQSDSLTKIQRKPLTDLIAQKSFEHEIDPLASSEFFGRNIPNIVGHRDLDQTLCPGSRVRRQLPQITAISASKFKKLARVPYAAKIISNTLRPAAFIGDIQTIQITFKNRGTEIWKAGVVFLQVRDRNDAISRYRHPSWPTAFGNFTTDADIAPGEKATFILQLTTPQEPGLYRNVYTLFHEDDAIPGGRSSSLSRVDSPFRAALIKHTLPLTMLSSWRSQVTLTFRNVGAASWDNNFVLHVQNPEREESQFFHKSWPKSTIAARAKEGTVPPGAVGTFTFIFDAPPQPGLYYNRFFLNTLNQKLIVQNGSFVWLTRIDVTS
ncbi:MAG: hypothetical protein A3B74_01895 [Candidatus Kerfeldbacteria bacterium RIFCSPHIGHO2_02_FULL_42_14]|uniref:Peptidoglycan recognition protein family domain-containing protein n=1 Tax=Candidatus Kerfeldbacteria bacterium RIFCSPHIGHO2_02_FULL_42_14 TaxID=1798540 RepID=A0A1G2ANG1_9BACT|nr:MAG: hypothetical protein A3B74_01895 [Candidatus Kerfeldbacteria bacterium RIFCSPHIGHO2_02_FULL_42_14]OGY81773.1 MAG: hypothetical protein A3E60_00470 [Candidatus Kerfeldbacteria bacterium RIFCSPHIGHO2_12_FULL_42_13]OGY84462.1 MAG: hypothetical protein A3I91_00085 [Candidatus Kerfeldbacteria bacterium RIFCSPLOWO2_02_FULL_42_19]OGY87997.1 MAG: hypothetical protein A3G01_04245 [Candidatus Kerfeldbacteria bacterium RIFCSPLOWO2_12_FULL_43_9]